MHEKYTKAGQLGSLQVIVAKRFEVDVDGVGVSMDAVHGAMQRVDLARLEAMKTQSAAQAANK
jgi:cyclopropane fatty-acyl-phospholipid synthase-like methyltransferase